MWPQTVLVKKLRLCCVLFDFKKDLAGDIKAKELKRQTLLELVDHVSQSKNAFTVLARGSRSSLSAHLSSHLFA